MAKDSVYCKESADYAVAFIQALRHTSGIWDGQPFELIDWQEQIIRDVFGVLKPNGYRQFNTAYFVLNFSSYSDQHLVDNFKIHKSYILG